MQASVLIVEYASRAFLRECLEALERSHFPRDEFEVIVVDNASPTPVAELVSEFPFVRFITSRRNLGFAGGNLLALEHARGRHIALLNPDAVAAPDWLVNVLRPLEDPDVGIVGSKLLHPGTDVLQHAGGVLLPNALSAHLGRGELDRGQWDGPVEVDYVCGAAWAIRREVIERVGFLSPVYFPAYYEETELCRRAKRAGYRVVMAADAVVEHHEGVSSESSRAKAYLERFHTGRVRYVVRNYSARELLTRFVPAELSWLAKDCPPAERLTCMRAYLSGVRSAWDSSRGTPADSDVVSDSWKEGIP
ncbi:MAG: glycosyltransferase family 2 protein [Myxococcales bacterium]|nr:glycosyltransferase family 2 protein [Myxococcales bacterium]